MFWTSRFQNCILSFKIKKFFKLGLLPPDSHLEAWIFGMRKSWAWMKKVWLWTCNVFYNYKLRLNRIYNWENTTCNLPNPIWFRSFQIYKWVRKKEENNSLIITVTGRIGVSKESWRDGAWKVKGHRMEWPKHIGKWEQLEEGR